MKLHSITTFIYHDDLCTECRIYLDNFISMRSIKMLFSLLTRDNDSTNAFNSMKYFTRSVTNTFS